jgi:hypothetical protein
MEVLVASADAGATFTDIGPVELPGLVPSTSTPRSGMRRQVTSSRSLP